MKLLGGELDHRSSNLGAQALKRATGQMMVMHE